VTISYSGGTGSPAAADQGSTTISVAYPTGVATGRIALLHTTAKLSGAVFGSAPAGFTFVGEQAGGTGASAADAGTTKIGTWFRVLDGTETGSVNISTDSGESMAGWMDIRQGTVGGWATPILVGGSDATHAADWSVTFGAWADALAVDDWVVGAMSSDTDVVQSITGRTLTQSGITFGGNFFRSRSLSTTGNDCGGYSFDWSVTAGSNANAPSYTHTTGTSQCGAMALVRLRETTGVPPAVPSLFVTQSGLRPL
jgi:hypothetical protein